MKVAYTDSLSYKVEQRINSLPYNVILRADLADLGGKRQVTYAIKQLIKNKKITRLGYGLYAKLQVFKLTGETYLKEPGGFAGTIREALDRLDIPWQQSEAEEAYNSGRSMQVPVRSILRLKVRLKRKIRYSDNEFRYQKVS